LLEPGPLRFSVLRRLVVAIVGVDLSKRIMALKLQELERDGLVCRLTVPASPPHVEYSLTPIGVGFAGQIKGLIDWSRSVIPEILEARKAYDEAH
jgi:DNA-binding HxlR family transcriptional regulator